MRYLKTGGLGLALCLLVAVLSGCVSVSATAGVDADNSAYITYRLECDTESGDEDFRESARSAMDGLAVYYGEQGFRTEHSYEGAVYWLEVTRTERRGSLEEAYEHLEEMLLDESISLFTNVDLGWRQSEYHTAYVASVTFEPAQILDTVEFENVPFNVHESLNEAMENIESSLYLTIPGTEIVQASGGPEQLAGFVRVSTGGKNGPLAVYLSTIISTAEAEQIRESLDDAEELEPVVDPEEARFKQILWLLCGVCFIISFICLAVLVGSILGRGREKR